jgi:hypothetical protein
VLIGRVPWLEHIYANPVRWRKVAGHVEAMGRKDDQRRIRRRDKMERTAKKLPQQALVWLKTTAKHALGAVGLIRHS